MIRGAPTIRDVARAAGVSTSTVSRALSRPDLVNDRTRRRVKAVSDQLGYEPSALAKGLFSGNSNALTLIVPDVTNPFFFGVIRGAQHEAARAGYAQLLIDVEESPQAEQYHLNAARKLSDGVILAGSRLSDGVLRAASDGICQPG